VGLFFRAAQSFGLDAPQNSKKPLVERPSAGLGGAWRVVLSRPGCFAKSLHEKQQKTFGGET
jgi:hypothetical protein